MSGSKMPRDANNHPIAALRPKANGAKAGTAGAASSRVGPFSAGVRVISIYAAGDIRYQTGDQTVVALVTSHKLAAGERHTISLGPDDDIHTHIAILRDGGADVTAEISELE